jgi:lactate dehydrogenase-like 2-hydroxyacid dehydrogenase
MKFKQIVILDDINFSGSFMNKLKNYSQSPVKIFSCDPIDQNEIQKRIFDADCVLLSWRTSINKELILSCNNLKFICLCGTNSNCIDLEACFEKNIIVSNVRDYGDEGVVEWIFFQLLSLVRGFGKYQWKNYPAELCGKTIGIIGFGAIGKLLADVALGFKMKVLYNSRTRNFECENKGIIFVEKKDLFQKSDIISLQTPKNVKILNKEEFDLMQGKILVNNTLGKAFNEDDFRRWIKKENNYLIMDMVSDFHDDFKNLDRVIYSDIISGKTKESIFRLSQKVLNNISSYLLGQPINKIN